MPRELWHCKLTFLKQNQAGSIPVPVSLVHLDHVAWLIPTNGPVFVTTLGG